MCYGSIGRKVAILYLGKYLRYILKFSYCNKQTSSTKIKDLKVTQFPVKSKISAPWHKLQGKM